MANLIVGVFLFDQKLHLSGSMSIYTSYCHQIMIYISILLNLDWCMEIPHIYWTSDKNRKNTETEISHVE